MGSLPLSHLFFNMGEPTVISIIMYIIIILYVPDRPKDIHQVRVPVKNEKTSSGLSLELYPILHPHEILSYLWNDVGIEVSEAEIAEYWRHCHRHGQPWVITSPATEKHIPIGLHGDAARLWSQEKFEKVIAIHLNICHFRPRSVRFSRWCVFSCPAHKVFKNRTLNAVWNCIVWSLEAAFQGLHPTARPGGKPLQGREQRCAGQPLSRSGAKWALTELRGDWEWHVTCWRPTASWQSNKICFRCPAEAKSNQVGNLYWNHGDDCTWESEEFGLNGFISRRLRDNNLCA